MKIYVKFNINDLCTKVLQDTLEKHNIKHSIISFGEVDVHQKIDANKFDVILKDFEKCGIEVVQSQKSILVQKIKDSIIDMVYNVDNTVNVKSSVYLSEKLDHSYGYLANLFSEVTYTSIENYIILQKIEYAKQLIISQELTLTEIAFKLNYSSVAHLSAQFKKTTGITPSAFQRIIAKRKELNNL